MAVARAELPPWQHCTSAASQAGQGGGNRALSDPRKRRWVLTAALAAGRPYGPGTHCASTAAAPTHTASGAAHAARRRQQVQAQTRSACMLSSARGRQRAPSTRQRLHACSRRTVEAGVQRVARGHAEVLDERFQLGLLQRARHRVRFALPVRRRELAVDGWARARSTCQPCYYSLTSACRIACPLERPAGRVSGPAHDVAS